MVLLLLRQPGAWAGRLHFLHFITSSKNLLGFVVIDCDQMQGPCWEVHNERQIEGSKLLVVMIEIVRDTAH